MPQSGRGGKRKGKDGVAHPQRTDLNERVPVVPVKGGTYGSGVESELVQAQIQSSAPAGASAVAPAALGGPTMPSRPLPGGLTGPTSRPGEDVAAGLSRGPGPGPEVLGMPPMSGVERYRPLLPVLELVASQPDTSSETRNFVRRLRGALGTGT